MSVTAVSQRLPVHGLESLVACWEVGGGSDHCGGGHHRAAGLGCGRGARDRPGLVLGRVSRVPNRVQ